MRDERLDKVPLLAVALMMVGMVMAAGGALVAHQSLQVGAIILVAAAATLITGVVFLFRSADRR